MKITGTLSVAQLPTKRTSTLPEAEHVPLPLSDAGGEGDGGNRSRNDVCMFKRFRPALFLTRERENLSAGWRRPGGGWLASARGGGGRGGEESRALFAFLPGERGRKKNGRNIKQEKLVKRSNIYGGDVVSPFGRANPDISTDDFVFLPLQYAKYASPGDSSLLIFLLFRAGSALDIGGGENVTQTIFYDSGVCIFQQN
ncbi:hypothetical protein GWI33_003683 [Rhynchophorus ferrugineus]|uniref:Uncharacterized protein n=1 Tax=Rhynchophorus ferrugineus TaxID=354439 RepID=A0A834LXV2_RHYFE|nr:hypothetical protein GWI33_003683 [Rhynchophorus ferrugineus]